jgi:hypothetical protein
VIIEVPSMRSQSMTRHDLPQVLQWDDAHPEPCGRKWYRSVLDDQWMTARVATTAHAKSRPRSLRRVHGAIVYEALDESVEVYRLVGTPGAMSLLLQEVRACLRGRRVSATIVVSEYDDAARRALVADGWLGRLCGPQHHEFRLAAVRAASREGQRGAHR